MTFLMVEPPSREALEELSDRSMPGFVRDRVGDWVVRAALGATGRANTAWARGDAGRPVGAAIDDVETWYRARSLRPGFQIFDGTGSAVTEELADRGYVESPGALVMWSPIDQAIFGSPSRVRPTEAVVGKAPTQRFVNLIGDPDRVREIVSSSADQSFIELYGPDGQLIGGGKSDLDGESLGIFSVLTADSARRQGVASEVMRHLLAHGRSGGARWIWLQVMGQNLPARTLYERAGLRVVHRYEYLFAPDDS